MPPSPIKRQTTPTPSKPWVRTTLFALSTCCPLVIALADDTKAPPASDRIEVTGKRRTDEDVRRESTVAKVVVSHEEVMRYGDSNVGDVLKRLPGVTVGGGGRSGGEIRMRGLGSGYTQIMINGEPAPRGFALDSISPELIERIEIVRSPMAEYGAQAIAGTINIVLRQVPTKRTQQFTLTESLEDNNHPESRAAFEYTGKSDQLSYVLAGTIKNMGQLEGSSYAHTTEVDPTGKLLVDQHSTDSQYRKGYNGNITPRVNWSFGEDDTASLQLFAFRRQAVDQVYDAIDQPVGTPPYTTQTGRTLSDAGTYKFTAERDHPFAVEPLYLRASSAEEKWAKLHPS